MNTEIPTYHGSMNTADILVDKLIAWDVSLIFSLAGDGINPIFEALRKRKDRIRLISVRHEESAAFMAAGYAKATGRLGVCLATTGPGAIHLMNGLYDAAMEGAAVLALTGTMPSDITGTSFFQEVNTISMLQDIAVYNQVINGPIHAQTVVDLACRAAMARPGVAHLTVATDIQQQQLQDDRHSRKGGKLTGSSTFQARREVPPEIELDKAAEILGNSKRTIILAGMGALPAKAELLQLAMHLKAPVTKALLGKALLPDNSPYSTGGVGRLGTQPSFELMKACDTLLILGSNMPYLDYYPEEAIAIQVDRDPQRIGLRYPVTLGLTGDVQATIQALLPKLKPKEDGGFLNLAQQKMAEWRMITDRLDLDESAPIKPQYLARLVSELVQDDAHISIDTGAHTVFTARHFSIKSKQDLLICGNLASMGPGLPYSIAAQLAYPARQCIAMVGDGGFTMLMGEMATAVFYKLPVKIILFKNNALSMDKFEQEEIGAEEYGIELQPINFAEVATACGAEGFSCSEPGKLRDTLTRFLASPNPALIQVDVDPNAAPDPPEKLQVLI